MKKRLLVAASIVLTGAACWAVGMLMDLWMAIPICAVLGLLGGMAAAAIENWL